MNILEFPPEIIHEILIYSILSRATAYSCARALRLKLVCKQFYVAFEPALFESQLLDRFVAKGHMEYWYIRNSHGAEKLWHSYLVHRVLNERDSAVGRYVEIREIAERIQAQIPGRGNYDATIDTLCWLALQRGSNAPGYRSGWASHSGREDDPPNADLNLLGASAYLGYTSLVEQLLQAGHSPTDDNGMFPSAMQLAAWAGNEDLLNLLEAEQHLSRSEGEHTGQWQLGENVSAIIGAAHRGDLGMMRLAINPRSRGTPEDSTDYGGQILGQLDRLTEPGSCLYKVLWNTRSWAVFQYVRAFFNDDPLLQDGVRLLAHYAELGSVDMVRGLLDAGVDMHGGDRHNCNPLVIAARFCHEDVVDLILGRGADPNSCEREQRGSALCSAAAGGSLAIVHKLINHGALPMGWANTMLKHSVLLEHEAMVQLLWERGLTEPSHGLNALQTALDESLESMVKLLHRYYIN